MDLKICVRVFVFFSPHHYHVNMKHVKCCISIYIKKFPKRTRKKLLFGWAFPPFSNNSMINKRETAKGYLYLYLYFIDQALKMSDIDKIFFFVVKPQKWQMFGWLTDWLIDRLTDWLIDWLTVWLIDWLTNWLLGN